ncbi:MAG: LON peptidase substrate-binding domain-containing protein, partial [Clostridiales bacterium]
MKTADNQVMPMMPLRGMLVFPNLMVHLDAGRDRSINAIEESLTEEENLIFLSMQKDAVTDEPELDDIYQIGTVAQIRQMLKLPGGTVRLLVEGKYRAKMIKVVQEQPYILAEIIPLAEEFGVQPLELEALVRILHHNFAEYAEQSKRISPEVLITIENLEEGDKLSDLVTSQLNISQSEKQALLEELSVPQRIEKIINILYNEMEILKIERNIAMKVRGQVEKNQKEYYLREQLKAIREELG